MKKLRATALKMRDKENKRMKITTNNDGSKTIDLNGDIILTKSGIEISNPSLIPGVRNLELLITNGKFIKDSDSFKYKVSTSLALLHYIWLRKGGYKSRQD